MDTGRWQRLPQLSETPMQGGGGEEMFLVPMLTVAMDTAK